MLKTFLQVVGWLLARTPESLLLAASAVLGRLMLLLSRRRRRLVHSNLDHAFPDRPWTWKRRIALESSQRLFETALLSLASPFLSDARLRRIASVSPELVRCMAEHHASPAPLVVATPHMAYWESLTWLALFADHPWPEFGVIFRPLDNPTADKWVRDTRERFGMKLLSRKTGLQEAFKILKRNGVIGLLFDQNAGLQGALTSVFGRVCSTTELPGMLAERNRGSVVVFYARRESFWRIRFEAAPLGVVTDSVALTLRLNRWFEQTLGADENLCSSWLWSHDRWRNQDIPERRFRLEAKRNLLEEEKQVRGWAELPRKTRVWIRLPNWLGDVVMVLPLLRALRESRPDAEITLIGKAAFKPLLEATRLAEHVEALPSRGVGYFLHFWRKRAGYPDVYLLFTHSLRGDIEAWLTGCRQRFGVVRKGKKRSLLSHAFHVPADYDESSHHQFDLWTEFLRRFGLAAEVSRAPLTGLRPATAAATSPSSPRIGCIAGSENSPEKRWPVEHWRALLADLHRERPDAHFVLFGTANDRPLTAAIRTGLEAPVEDLAGATDLKAYIRELTRCSLIVTNDTGGMHLANALGVPVIALFGPTNPVRTGPIFTENATVLQPPDCPPAGGAPLQNLRVAHVLAAVRQRL